MNKLYPNKLVFVDNAEPDINATNMNIISTALDEVDTRLAGIVPAEDYEELAEQTRINADKAKAAADSAEAIVGIGIATTERAGIVKPDGNTISVEEDGTIHCINGGANYDAELSDESENAPQNKAVTNALDNINVYVGEDGKIHFTDRTGADSALPFKPSISLAYHANEEVNQSKDKSVSVRLDKGRYIVEMARTTYSQASGAFLRITQDYFTISGYDSIEWLGDYNNAIAVIELSNAKTVTFKSLAGGSSASYTTRFLLDIFKIC